MLRPSCIISFVGFGIVSPERKHDDYRDAARGRIAMMLEREPGVNDPESIFDGVVTAEAATALRKVLAAQEKGAIGVIFVEDVHNQSGPSNFQAQAANYWPTPGPRVEDFRMSASYAAYCREVSKALVPSYSGLASA